MRLKKTVALALVTAMAATMQQAAAVHLRQGFSGTVRARRQAAKQQAARLTARRQRKGLPQGKAELTVSGVDTTLHLSLLP